MARYLKYQSIIDYIKNSISNGKLASGDKIPSEKEFANMMGVSNITVRKAMAELVNDGIIYRVKGKGSFISSELPQDKKGNNKLVAFLFSEITVNDNAYIQLLINMQKYFMDHNYSLIVECTDDTEKELLSIQKLIEKNVEGFIIYSREPEKNIQSYKYLDDNNIPFVLADRRTQLFPTNYVGTNNHDGAFTAARHLLQLNHTKIAFVANQLSLSSQRERFEGYSDAMKSASLPINNEHCFLDKDINCDRLIGDINNGNITAIMTANDRCAMKVMSTLYRKGLKIPDDVSIVGFDDSEVIRHSMVPLTTVKQYFNEIGLNAARLLIENITNYRRDYTSIGIGTKLIIRESTRML